MRHSLLSSLFIYAASLVYFVSAQSFPYIPDGNKVYLGAWPDAEVRIFLKTANYYMLNCCDGSDFGPAGWIQ